MLIQQRDRCLKKNGQKRQCFADHISCEHILAQPRLTFELLGICICSRKDKV